MSGPVKRRAPRLSVEGLEDRSVPAFGAAGLGLSVAVGDVDPNGTGNEYVVGAGPGTVPMVKVYDQSGTLLRQFLAFEPSFTGGVNVAIGDVDGNGSKEIIVGAGNGGAPLVAIFDGATGKRVGSFFAYEASFRGGVYVASGNVDGKGPDEIVTGAGFNGGPVVRVFNARGISVGGFFADEPGFRGGVTVAVADTNGDGKADIITGTGPGGGPVVRVFGSTGNQLTSFYAFDVTNRDGVTVAAGDTNGDTTAEIYATPSGNSDGSNPFVRVFNGGGLRVGGPVIPYSTPISTTLNMAVGDVTGDNIGDLVIVPGDTQLAAAPRVFVGAQGSQAGFNGP
jgi:hypothetical protein